MKPTLPFLETMITQACNLSCLGCTNYSDLPHKGYVTWADGKDQLESWIDRVDIPDFGIMGGEPLINPEVDQWITGVRKLMPSSQIRFTTNGILLSKNLEIIDLLSSIGNCVFKITVHQKESEVEDVIDYIMSRYKWTPVVEWGIHRFVSDNNFRFQINRPNKFLKTYQGSYADMHPHNSDPAQAFEICCQKTCPLLYKGKIYKCSTSGLLQETLERHGNPNLDLWEPYIQAGLSPDCDQQELEEFLDNFSKPHTMCRQCPTVSDQQSILIHYDTVSPRKQRC